MVFYPDNVPRRDRAIQLQNDISLLQNSAREAREAMDKEDARMLPYINQILKNHNMSTFDDLQQKLNDALSGTQKEMYDDLVNNARRLSVGDDTALMVMSGILFSAGIVAKAIDIGNFLRAVNLVTVLRSYARAFITLVTEGVEAGMRAFRLVSTVFRWSEETLLETSQLARYAGNASRFLKVLSVIGIFADGFILAFDFFEQKKQKEELDKAINELYVSRIVAKSFARMCDAIKTQDGLMLGYLILVGDDGTISKEDQDAADKIVNKFVEYVKKDWGAITTASSLDLLVVLDKQRGSWTNEDPSYQDAIKNAEDQIKTDQPSSPGVHAVVSTSALVAKTAAHRLAAAEVEDFYPPPTYDTAMALVHLTDMKHEQLRLAY
ncbi:hypothetical protein CCMSSC00406_0007386 [Pleurotus cornucopiae]|uniref:Uncharacterized protein n=1 Tax=Pleurotus cornucopiae TaxID=5321 RepID=A0ACB7ISI2_PLECO|nr:hypothetical protein CCMSSC00406_0007386 [Pleurotus cornucopiae]